MKCTNYIDIFLLSLPEKVSQNASKSEIVERQLLDAQCRFRPGPTMDQIFALQQVFQKSWKYAKRCIHAL